MKKEKKFITGLNDLIKPENKPAEPQIKIKHKTLRVGKGKCIKNWVSEAREFLNTFACGGINKTWFNTKELSAVALPFNQAGSAAVIVRRIFL